MMKLQKFVIQAAQLARRQAIAEIEQGNVTVDGKTVREPFALIEEMHHVITLSGKKLAYRAPADMIVLVHKPRGYLTADTDPQKRPLVKSLFSQKIRVRLFPVGRLDFNSEGLLIFTNNGERAQQLAHPSYQIPRTYRVKIHGQLADPVLQKLRKGFPMPDFGFVPGCRASIERSTGNNTWLTLTIRQGRNRELRKIFEFFRVPVVRLIRTAYGPFDLKGMAVGTWRICEQSEINRLEDYLSRSKKKTERKAGGK